MMIFVESSPNVFQKAHKLRQNLNLQQICNNMVYSGASPFWSAAHMRAQHDQSSYWGSSEDDDGRTIVDSSYYTGVLWLWSILTAGGRWIESTCKEYVTRIVDQVFSIHQYCAHGKNTGLVSHLIALVWVAGCCLVAYMELQHDIYACNVCMCWRYLGGWKDRRAIFWRYCMGWVLGVYGTCRLVLLLSKATGRTQGHCPAGPKGPDFTVLYSSLHCWAMQLLHWMLYWVLLNMNFWDYDRV